MRLLTDFAEYIFREITYTNDKITPEILDWRPVKEANSIHWILTHQTRIASLLIPQVITGTHNPAGWDDNYQEQPHSLEELRNDLREAREKVLSLLDGLEEEDLNRKIMVWGSKQPLKEAIFALLGELMHHNGQIAMLKGIKKRTNARL
ncbi:MAG: DinB family protein [Candidatus Bathyarchaeia archaeon]|jgi:uncharacterized damage-inducible protein DinB